MVWLFLQMLNATFETIFWEKFSLGAAWGAPKVKKLVFGKNTKWRPAVLFVNKFFWSKNKSGPFWEDSAGVQNLEPFQQKMAKLWPEEPHEIFFWLFSPKLK